MRQRPDVSKPACCTGGAAQPDKSSAEAYKTIPTLSEFMINLLKPLEDPGNESAALYEPPRLWQIAIFREAATPSGKELGRS
jgi:hypothetical protein